MEYHTQSPVFVGCSRHLSRVRVEIDVLRGVSSTAAPTSSNRYVLANRHAQPTSARMMTITVSGVIFCGTSLGPATTRYIAASRHCGGSRSEPDDCQHVRFETMSNPSALPPDPPRFLGGYGWRWKAVSLSRRTKVDKDGGMDPRWDEVSDP